MRVCVHMWAFVLLRQEGSEHKHVRKMFRNVQERRQGGQYLAYFPTAAVYRCLRQVYGRSVFDEHTIATDSSDEVKHVP